MRAVCTAEYKDSSGQDQKIELTHWLTSLSRQQIMQILEQQQRERLYAEEIAGQNTGGEELPLEGENQNQDFEGEAELNSRQSRANNLGPPPPGYDSWDDVPAKDLFKMLKNGAGK